MGRSFIMASKRIKKTKKLSELSLPAKVFLQTLLLTLILYSISFLLSAAVGLSMNISKSNSFYLAMFAFSLCSFIGAFYAGRKIHKNGISIGFLFCLPMNAVILLASIAANSFRIDLTALISFFILSVASMLGGIVSVNMRIKVKKGRIK